jgi:hypothetical protein
VLRISPNYSAAAAAGYGSDRASLSLNGMPNFALMKAVVAAATGWSNRASLSLNSMPNFALMKALVAARA